MMSPCFLILFSKVALSLRLERMVPIEQTMRMVVLRSMIAHFPLCIFTQTNCKYSNYFGLYITNSGSFSGWIPNTDLLELDFDTIGTVPTSMRKDLQAAHQLAAERHDLQYFKDILQNFMDQRAAEVAAKEAAKAAKKATKDAAKSKPRKSLSKTVVAEEDEDVEMEDAVAEQDSDGIEIPVEKAKKTKKRKAEEDVAVRHTHS